MMVRINTRDVPTHGISLVNAIHVDVSDADARIIY